MEGVLRDPVIGIYYLDVCPAGIFDTCIKSLAVAAVFLVDRPDGFRIFLFVCIRDRRSIFSLTIIYDNDLKTLPLAQKTLDAVLHIVLGIVAGDHDSKYFFIHVLILLKSLKC